MSQPYEPVVLVLYATREGQTRRIAEHVAAALRQRGLSVDLRNVAEIPSGFSLAPYRSAILAASVHLGKHEPEMIGFVRAHRAALEQLPEGAAFLSVSGSQGSAANHAAPDDIRARARADVQRALDTFLKDTGGWHPARTLPVAGALLFRQYNPLLRFVMRRIARSQGVSDDTTRDTEYTDWPALDRFVEDWASESFVGAAASDSAVASVADGVTASSAAGTTAGV